MTDDVDADLEGQLKEQGFSIQESEAIKAALRDRIGGPACIAFMGQSGVGKSSLCNAIFGKDVARVSDVGEGTRREEGYELGMGIRLIDLPGIGHDVGKDAHYRKLYRNVLPRCDLVLWLFQADTRANAADQKVFGQDVKPNLKSGTPVIPVIAKADKIDPSFEWNLERFELGLQQCRNIEQKRAAVGEILGRAPGDVAVVAVHALPTGKRMLGVKELVQQIVHELPDNRKEVTFRHVKPEAATPKAKKEAEEGLLNTIKEVIKEFIVSAGPVIVREVGKALARWWQSRKTV